MSVCLDAFALLCWLQDEPGAGIVEQHLSAVEGDEKHFCPISLINLGEVFYRLVRTRGREIADGFWNEAQSGVLPVAPVAVTRSRVQKAAALKGKYAIAYADAFAIQLALERGLPLVTGDPEMRVVEDSESVEILWLPAV